LDEPEINTNCTSSKSSSEIETVATQSVIAGIFREEIQKSIANSTVESKVPHDIKPVNIVNKFSENSKLSHERETITNTSPTFYPETERPEEEYFSSDKLSGPKEASSITNCQTFSKIAIKFVQGLLKELLSSDDKLQTIKFSPLRILVPRSISIKKLANSFCQANVARDKSIIAK